MDEKTGIQAIERDRSNAPKSKGEHQRIEYEYTRHGTTTLIAANNVENGRLMNYHLGSTRTEEDYANFLKETVTILPEMDQIIFLSDQLNTHISETIVLWIAEMEEYDSIEIGLKGKSGFLKNMKTRKAFLERKHHRVQFCFTPKHCSWLNPIENWFAKLQRQIIQKGNFVSVNQLIEKIEVYIEFYNQFLAKPLKWKFKGFNKNKKFNNN